MNVKYEIHGMSIVILGTLNPKIFHPAWFAHHQLIGSEESENATLEINHPDVSIFELEWAKIQVTRERFSIITEQEPYFPIARDLTLGIFSLLRHTPVKIMGINRNVHAKMDNEKEWHEFGHRIAPKEIWKKCFPDPGLNKLVMQYPRQDDLPGKILVRVEKSNRIHPGIFVEVNDHYDSKDTGQPAACDEFIDILMKNWDKSMQNSVNMFNCLFEG